MTSILYKKNIHYLQLFHYSHCTLVETDSGINLFPVLFMELQCSLWHVQCYVKSWHTHSAIYGMYSAIYGMHSAIYGILTVLFMACTVLFMAYSQ